MQEPKEIRKKREREMQRNKRKKEIKKKVENGS